MFQKVKNLVLLMVASALAILLLSREQNVLSQARNTLSTGLRRDTSSFNEAKATEPFDPQIENWPKLDSLIGDLDKNIKKDVSFMLDFAIIAHPKTATTFTMTWLASHEEIEMYTHELHAMQAGRPAELISLFYDLKPGYGYKRGYKAPRDICSKQAMEAMHKFFPTTKLMVGLRHPVSWFESFYNFRVRGGYKMPPAETLFGRNRQGAYGVVTDEAKFHHNLDNFRKTNRTEDEMKLLNYDEPPPNMPKMDNEVFLYEINQLHDDNKTRAEQYLRDLKSFLGLKQDLQPIVPEQSRSKNKAINICDDRFRFIRAELMKSAVEASIWIREYFLKSPDVSVSSPDYFNDLLKTWLVDPCTLKYDTP